MADDPFENMLAQMDRAEETPTWITASSSGSNTRNVR